MQILALDIGGANIKLAHSGGRVASWQFPLWQRPGELGKKLTELLATAPAADRLVVTITGELADCYATKAEGVAAILSAVQQAADAMPIAVYLCDGNLVGVRAALAEPLLAAASNWHVLATYAARYCAGGAGLLLDLGSTTCDIIPIENGKAHALGRTDPERLVSHELVYTGVQRSPVCAVVQELDWRGEPCSVAQEVFATTVDAYLILGELTEDSADLQTADGRPRTKAAAHARLARTICADTTMFSTADAKRAAASIRNQQLQQLLSAVQAVTNKMKSVPQTVVLSGQGEFLLSQLVEHLDFTPHIVSLAEQVGPEASSAACAYALAVIAQERPMQ